MLKKTRGRPKKELMSDAHRAQLMASVDLMVTTIQESERYGFNRGYDEGALNGYYEGNKDSYEQYYDGLLKGYCAGTKAAADLKKDEDFNFWNTLFSTLAIGSVLILLWWALSGQIPPWR